MGAYRAKYGLKRKRNISLPPKDKGGENRNMWSINWHAMPCLSTSPWSI